MNNHSYNSTRLLSPALYMLTIVMIGCQAVPTVAPTATAASSATATVAPSPTREPSATAAPPSVAPTLMATWPVTIDGWVYDASACPARPIASAGVKYSRFSYQPLPSSGQAVTDGEGRYRLVLQVHDTDSITISADAAEFTSSGPAGAP